jgi:hypothetical protein
VVVMPPGMAATFGGFAAHMQANGRQCFGGSPFEGRTVSRMYRLVRQLSNNFPEREMPIVAGRPYSFSLTADSRCDAL